MFLGSHATLPLTPRNHCIQKHYIYLAEGAQNSQTDYSIEYLLFLSVEEPELIITAEQAPVEGSYPRSRGTAKTEAYYFRCLCRISKHQPMLHKPLYR